MGVNADCLRPRIGFGGGRERGPAWRQTGADDADFNGLYDGCKRRLPAAADWFWVKTKNSTNWLLSNRYRECESSADSNYGMRVVGNHNCSEENPTYRQ